MSSKKKRARSWECGGKRRYRSKDQALHVLRAFVSTSTRDRVPVRVYQCPTCRGFHLTSQEKRT